MALDRPARARTGLRPPRAPTSSCSTAAAAASLQPVGARARRVARRRRGDGGAGADLRAGGAAARSRASRLTACRLRSSTRARNRRCGSRALPGRVRAPLRIVFSALCSGAAAPTPACHGAVSWRANAPRRSSCREPPLDEIWPSLGFRRLLEPGQPSGRAAPLRSRSASSSPQRADAPEPVHEARDLLSSSTRTSARRCSLMGSLARFDRDQYTWKSDSSLLPGRGAMNGRATFTTASCSCSVGHTLGC